VEKMKKQTADNLIAACKRDNLNYARQIVEGGVSPNRRGRDGYTPLGVAALYGRLEMLKYFVEAGGNVNAGDRDGATPLHWTVCNGHLDVARYLLKAGVDVNSVDRYEDTVLHYAMRLCSSAKLLSTVMFLIDHGADPGAMNYRNQTVLDVAMERRSGKDNGLTLDEHLLLAEYDFEQVIDFFKDKHPELVMEWWVRPGR